MLRTQTGWLLKEKKRQHKISAGRKPNSTNVALRKLLCAENSYKIFHGVKL